MTRRQFLIWGWKFVLVASAMGAGRSIAIRDGLSFGILTLFGILALLSFEHAVRADERGGYR